MIVPTHCVSNEIEQDRLTEYRLNHAKAATQPIYLIKRANGVLPVRSQSIMDLLIKAKQGQV